MNKIKQNKHIYNPNTNSLNRIKKHKKIKTHESDMKIKKSVYKQYEIQ